MCSSDLLAEKESLSPADLLDKPLIVSRQMLRSAEVGRLLGCKQEKLNIVGTYNLLYNGSLMVDEVVDVVDLIARDLVDLHLVERTDDRGPGGIFGSFDNHNRTGECGVVANLLGH